MTTNLTPGRDKRVLWLLNHTTLRESEVPLLRELGFEIFTPKSFPNDAGNRSASVTFEFDKTLSISREDLDTLNRFNFYTDDITPAVRNIINREFGAAIVAYMFPMLDNMIAQYQNRILLRAFGLTSTSTYYDFAHLASSPGFKRRISRAGDRFWFAQAYPNLSQIEPKFIRERTLDLPLGLPKRITDEAGTWTGGDRKLLFVCPDIKTFSENENIYRDFKKNFGHLPHVICGSQTVPVLDDPAVLGRVPGEEYARLFRECSVMFYHSQLPRHLHYHPVEAVSYGMPLVYMKQGMLGALGGSDLPGACSTVKEARTKIERILIADDRNFRDQVRNSQPILLEHFSPGNNEAKWKDNFVGRALSTPPRSPQLKRRIAILALDGSLSSCTEALRLAKELLVAAQGANSNIQFMVGLPRAEKAWPKFDPMPGLIPRELKWTPSLDNSTTKTAQRMLGFAVPLFGALYSIPEDGSSQFMECESWLLVGAEIDFQPAPLKPYAVYAVPTRFLNHVPSPGRSSQDDGYSQLLHSARAVMSSDDTTLDRISRKYGMRPEMLLNLANPDDGGLNRFQLWQTMQELA